MPIIKNVIKGLDVRTNEAKAEQESLNARMQQCISGGGQWDEAARKCVFPEKQAEPPESKEKFPATDDPVLTLAREKGLSLEAAADILLAKKRQSPAKQLAEASVDFRNKESAQIEQSQLLTQQQAGVQFLPDERELPGDSLLSHATTGAAAVGGAVVGAKFGAAAGTLIAPGIGTVIGGVVGAVGGAVGGAFTKLTVQKRQQVKEANKVFTQSKSNRAEILNMINAGLLTEGQARELWQEEKQNIAAAHRALKFRTDNDLEEFLGNPRDELIAIESYLRLESQFDLEFEKALLAPNPNRIRIIQGTNET